MTRRIAIVHSSWHGHTRMVADHLSGIAALHDIVAMPCDVRTAKRSHVLELSDGVIVVGSVHFGRHQSDLRRFVTRNLSRMATMPSAFVSVSGAAASIDGREKAESYMVEFLEATGWRPDQKIFVAGALLYTRYDPLTRLAMKFASRIAGRGTDTTRDYVYTDWFVLDEFFDSFAGTMDRAKLLEAATGR